MLLAGSMYNTGKLFNNLHVAEKMADANERAEKRLSCVAVYCGSSPGKKPIYEQVAVELGRSLASKKIKVVFGGSRYGLLGILADSVVNNGGQITGIIPEFFTKYDNYEAIGEEIVVPDMHTRKKMMFDRAEGFIALPGGIGTMEELTEIMTWLKLDLHTKPIGLLNVNGYYNHFIQWLTHAIAEGFVPAKTVDEILVVSDSPSELIDQFCLRWKMIPGDGGHADDVM